jgi:dipeptidyl aminopeptidase/acylaminoacyl peptidase
VDTGTGVIQQSATVDQVAVGSWTAAERPLLGLSIATSNGWNSTIDGTTIDQETVGLSQLAISSTTGSSFFLVGVDASANLRRYDCNILNDGSGGISVEVATNQVLTTSGGYSNPSISPDGTKIAAQRGSAESSEIVIMSTTGNNVTAIATGRQPFWR